MFTIRAVTIKNFRSIIQERIVTNEINLFVGLNDVGKSNVIKALNLFFNNETDEDHTFDFQNDYSKLAPYRSNKAKEISITLEIEIPATFKESGIVIWKKVWRANGLHNGERDYYHKKRSDYKKTEKRFEDRSKIPAALDKIKFQYIPAVKSAEFYKKLLERLYNSASLNEMADGNINDQAKYYSVALVAYTKRLSEIVKKRIGIDTILTMPNNQRDVFRALSFGTKDSAENDIPLDYRGDGIKSRHIPAILKFIEEEDMEATKNAVSVTTIWGYEEPENGIEMLKCFDLAEELYSYRDRIQMFISTHSPAFYSLLDRRGVKVFSVEQEEKKGTKILSEATVDSMNISMGFMPLVSPYILEQKKKIEEYKELMGSTVLVDIPTIIVEGKTDKYYLNNAINTLSPKLQQLIEDGKLRIFTRIENGCGIPMLLNYALIWCLTQYKSPALILFDRSSGIDGEKKKIIENPIYLRGNVKPRIEYIEPSDHIVELFKNEIHLSFSIEHLLPNQIWEMAKNKGILRDRVPIDLMSLLSRYYQDLTTTGTELVEELQKKGINIDYRVLCTIPDDKKSSFQNVVGKSSIDTKLLYQGFSRTIAMIEKIFK